MNRWIQGLRALTELVVPRFLFQQDCSMNCVKSIQIHHFSDALSVAYSVLTYLRFVTMFFIVLFLARQASHRLRQYVSIPRLELMAAVLAVKIDQMLQQELILPIWQATFCTDSTAVLQMIAHTKGAFRQDAKAINMTDLRQPSLVVDYVTREGCHPSQVVANLRDWSLHRLILITYF